MTDEERAEFAAAIQAAKADAWDEGHGSCPVAFHNVVCHNPFRPVYGAKGGAA